MQFSTVAVGFIVVVPQKSSMASIVAVGGFFTSITCVLVSVPHPVTMLCVIEYLPGFLNKNCGFSEFSSVPSVNSQSDVLPQLSAL